MRETAEKGFFWQWGKSMFRLRWMIVSIWIVLFICLAFFAQKAPALLKDNGFTPKGSDSDLGLIQLQQKLDYPASTFTLIYQSENLKLSEPEASAQILDSLNDLRKLPYVMDVALVQASRLPIEHFEHVSSNLKQENVQAVNVFVQLNGDQALDHYADIKALIHAPTGMQVSLTGGTAILFDMQDASKKDIVKSEVIGLPIAVVVLLIIFGTVLGAILPLIVGLMSVTVTLGITYFIAQSVSLSNFLPNIVTMLGLAVGIDYALFLVSRFREELKTQATIEDAVAMTSQTAGKSIFFSGVAVLIGLFGMLFIDLSIYRSLCLGGVIVVSVSVLVAETLLLALLSLFGTRINALRVIPSRFRRKEASHFWEKIAYGVMKRPVTIIVVMGAILLFFTYPVGQMKLGMPDSGVLPPSYESRAGTDLLNQAFDAREMNPIQIYVENDQSVWDEATIERIQAYINQLNQLTGVKAVKSYLSEFKDLTSAGMAAQFKSSGLKDQIVSSRLAKENSAVIIVQPEYDPEDSQTDRLVKDIRELNTGALKTMVTGGTAYRVDMLQRIRDGIPKVVGFVMIVTYLILLMAFRSILLPLKAVLMNLLSLGASMGIVVTVFQKGFLADLLHITSIGYVSATLPVIIFCVVFGISMDYEVFLISRIAEEYEKTGDNEVSTAEGLKKTGSLITSAAFILIVVVGAFIFTDIEIIKALGLGLTLAVLIDATLIRILIVPSLMKLLGRANWWAPQWIKGKSKVKQVTK
ncbi:MMPL family transporter [Paenibacillus psychroresistens]|nr:MMPL family transporter [Paenibacillus psychroresistens]